VSGRFEVSHGMSTVTARNGRTKKALIEGMHELPRITRPLTTRLAPESAKPRAEARKPTGQFEREPGPPVDLPPTKPRR
jgi:hypothetical protein